MLVVNLLLLPTTSPPDMRPVDQNMLVELSPCDLRDPMVVSLSSSFQQILICLSGLPNTHPGRDHADGQIRADGRAAVNSWDIPLEPVFCHLRCDKLLEPVVSSLFAFGKHLYKPHLGICVELFIYWNFRNVF